MALILAGSGGDPEVEQTTTIAYKFNAEDQSAFTPGTKHLIQASIPIEPGTLVPQFYHPTSGLLCDMIPMSWNPIGKPDMYQLVCEHTVVGSETEVTFTTQPGVAKIDPGIRYATADLSGLTVNVRTTASGLVFTGSVGNAIQKRVWRSGNYVDEREFWVRTSGPSGEEGPGVRFFVDRRSDGAIVIRLINENSLWDPQTANLTGVDPRGTGEVFYEDIYLTAVPTGYFPVACELDESHSSLATGVLVKPENVFGGSGNEQLLPHGQDYPHAFVLRHGSIDTVRGNSIGRFVGYGFPRAGDYTVYKGRGYGGSRLPGINFADARIDHEGQPGTGLQNTLARDTQHLNDIRGYLQNNTVNSLYFPLARQGYFRPYGQNNIEQGGGADVNLFALGSLHGEGFRIADLKLRHVMQRHSSNLVDCNNGDLVDAEKLVELNGNGLMPWRMYHRCRSRSEKWNNEMPCFLPFGYTQSSNFDPQGNSDILTARAFGQESKPWNQAATVADRYNLPASIHQQRLALNSHQNGDPIIGPEADHHSRYFNFVDTLAYGANLGFAKFLAMREGVYAQRCLTRFKHDPAFDNINGAFFKTSGSLQESIDEINLQAKPNFAGAVGPANASGTFRDRGDGMMAYCVATGNRFAEPGSRYRMNALAWLDKWAECIKLTATPYGVTARNDTRTGLIQYGGSSFVDPFGLLAYPGSDDLIGDYDGINRENALPCDETLSLAANPFPFPPPAPANEGYISEAGSGLLFSVQQSYMPCYVHFGSVACMMSIAVPGSTAWTDLECALKYLDYMYLYGRASGESSPFAWAIISEGGAGAEDTPGTGQGPWPGDDIRPGSWKFNPGEFATTYNSEPRDYVNGVYPAYKIPRSLDNRQLVLMAQTMWAMHEKGDTTALARMLQNAKDFAGVPAGTLDDLIGALFTGYNGEAQAQIYQNEYLRSEYGSMIATIEGLRELGAIS